MLNPAQSVAWCRTVLRRAAIRSAARYRRWNGTHLLDESIDAYEARGKLLPDRVNPTGPDIVELWLIVESLPSRHRDIVVALYAQGLTQREAAQSGVSARR